MYATGRRQGPPLVRAAQAICAALMTAALVLPVAAHATNSESDDPFPLVASIDAVTDAQGNSISAQNWSLSHVAVDVPLRRLVLSDGTSAVILFDLDTLNQTDVLDVGGRLGDAGVATALDDSGHRIFLGDAADGSWSQSGCFTFDVASSCRTESRKIRTISLTRSFPPSTFSLPNEFARQGIQALAYDLGRQRLYAITYTKYLAPAEVGGYPVARQMTLHALDATKLSQNSVPQDALLWSYSVEACGELVGGKGKGQDPFLGVSRSGDFVYFACGGVSEKLVGGSEALVRGTLNGVTRVNLDTAGTPVGVEFHPFGGYLKFALSTGDSSRDLLGIVVGASAAENRLYVFDAANRSWTGSVPMGYSDMAGGAPDTTSGRVYTTDEAKGVAVVDWAKLPVPQGQKFPLGVQIHGFTHPAFDPISRRLFVPGPLFTDSTTEEHVYSFARVYEDRTPRPVSESSRNPDDQTHQIDEDLAEDVTHTGGASGFGARLLHVGGLRGTQVGAYENQIAGLPVFGETLRPEAGDRGVFLGYISSAQLTGDSRTGAATTRASAASVDEATASDLSGKTGALGSELDEAAGSDGFWAETLADAVSDLRDQLGKESACSDYGMRPAAQTNRGSSVTCDEGAEVVEAKAWTPHEMADSPIRVAYASSEITITRDPERGIVSRSEAVARGIDILGAVHIDEVYSIAETWAKGRDGTADSTYRTSINGVRITDPEGRANFSCGFKTGLGDDMQGKCDPSAVVQAINARFPLRLEAQLGRREVNQLAIGSPGGAQALVIEDPYAYWSDFNVNHDGRKEVPALQFVFYNDGKDTSRVVIQLAAVLAESKYFVGAPRQAIVEDPGSIKVILTNELKEPLAGGLFEVYADEDGDGIRGLADPLLELGSASAVCTTGDDGIGDCNFERVSAGKYIMHQVQAPDGYVVAPDEPIDVAAGVSTTLEVQNLPAVGFITLALSDDADPPKPLPGASFEISLDLDGNQTLSPGDLTLATCTTNSSGGCVFQGGTAKFSIPLQCQRNDEGKIRLDQCSLEQGGASGNTLLAPLGTYIAHQTGAPPGYVAAPDRSETATNPYDEGRYSFINGLEEVAATQGTPGGGGSRSSSYVEEGVAPSQPIGSSAPVAMTEPNLAFRILRLPAEVWRFLQRHPAEALLFGLVWALIGSPLWLARRRRLGWLVANSASAS